MFKLVNIGQQNGHNFGPRFVKSLVPNWCFETLGFLLEILRGYLHNLEHFFVEFLLTTLLRHQIHFVDETEYFGLRAKVAQRFETRFVVSQVSGEVLGHDIEHENKHFHIFEDVVSLGHKVLLHEQILTAAVPQGKH